ncbi:hypothetical protein CPB85DRAFT_1440728 [Mucidula mucida]|nr:hypothetical protein CPB85DRAFT_1440728 [Mucidula mucida]
MPALINKSDSDWAIGSVVETNVRAGVYGLYATAALISAALLIHNGLRNSYARCALLVITIVMFGLCTAHVYLYTKFFTIQFPTLSSDPESFNPEWLVAECDRLQVITMILRRIAYFLSDAVVVWRTWCIWYDNAFVRAYLALVLIATGATSITTGIMYGRQTPNESNMLGTFCLLVTNFSTTILCAYKVWYYRQFIKSAYGGRGRKSLVENVLLILVESGSLYCLFWLFMMLFDYGVLESSRFGFEYFMPNFAGLYAAAIIIIVSLSKTSPETFYSVVDHDLQQQFTKPNGPRTLEKLEFAPPKSTLVTDVGASTTAMSRDGELLTINLDRRSDSDTSENSPG